MKSQRRRQDIDMEVLLGMRFAGRRRKGAWHRKTSLPKPELLASITVVADPFPQAVYDLLLGLMPATDTKAGGAADTFMDLCKTAAAFASSEHLRLPKAAECEQIKRVAEHLHKALAAISKMLPQTRWLIEQGAYVIASDPERPLLGDGGALLPAAWDFIAELEDAATMALNFGPVTNRDRDDEERAKSLAWFVADGYRELYGKLPPADSKGWFVPFMDALGQRAGVPCGPRIVSAVVKSIENAVK